ncbi:DHA2 family efflux MFS transporter permease subunit [Fimbriimonas ginsengisoli]|uniref:Inner membrane component of tripartite multidrug resistance system n=1 Tax=Fimbriimonas ginsengisoli Gsoil 348 TaxID=661478 RepID=A0A068NRM7_FIMGI|nr:DHA2 family efflux MFS transporter permease subunit [Fimbriimonas ginsengisoli]AIE86056.1 Inner membrane component of tripartite multidrug resistance system [Fimbriimonas ginsengisoli Gsoil 348]
MIAVSVSLAALLEVIDTSIVNVALTDMQATLGATLSEIGWVVTGYGIANVVMIPLSAWLGDAFGKKRYFVFSMIGFTVASIMCGMATTLPVLIGARIFQGLMGGGLLAKAQAFLFESFPKEEQGMAQALFGACVIAGPAIGPTLGGWLVTNFSWPWIFYINLPVGIAATLMCIAYLPEDVKRFGRKAVDYLGIVLLILWVGSLQILLEQGYENDWFDSRFISVLAVISSVGLVLWIWRELRTKAPAVDLRVLRHRSLTAGSVYAFVVGVGLYGALFAIPIFAQQVLGYTAYQTGMLLLPGAIASALMMPVMGRLSKVDARVLIALGSLVLIGSLVVVSRISILTGPEDLFWPLVFRGIGTVMIFLPLSLATFSGVPKEEVSAASGFYNLTRQLGGSVGIAVLTTILAQREAFHRSNLVEYVSAYSSTAAERLSALTGGFVARGAAPATARTMALKAMDRSVDVQAAVLSFGDMFHIVAFLFVVSLGLLFLMGSGKRSAAPVDVH